VVATRSKWLPDDLPLVIRAPESIRLLTDLGAGLAALREEGVRSLLCEGGPTLNSTLFADGLVDELFLTVAPTIAGAAEQLTAVEGLPLPAAIALELSTVHEAEGHLFLRYRVS
jgi:riboflavin biosynthesis pyrimidine reductase